MSIRYAILASLLLAGAVAAESSVAGVPSPPTSTVPARLVACPAGDATYVVTVRDLANYPVTGCDVILDFSACPEFPVCADCCAGVTVDRQARRATALSDAMGQARFPLKMGGVCGGATVSVYASMVMIGTTHLASPDQDGDLVVGASDAAIVSGLIGTSSPGADFDADGTVTSLDLDWLGDFHGGHSCTNVVPVRPATWGAVKILYR